MVCGGWLQRDWELGTHRGTDRVSDQEVHEHGGLSQHSGAKEKSMLSGSLGRICKQTTKIKVTRTGLQSVNPHCCFERELQEEKEGIRMNVG